MDPAAQLIVTLSGLVLAALAAASAGARIGAPLLLVFLAVGFLAGAEGPGGLVIGDVDLAFAGAQAALAIILLDGGLRTRPEMLALGLRPGLALATGGVAITAGVTALAAMLALDVGWREGLLIGAIVSSTDAAAVFSLIGARGAPVRPRLAATLETESGLNDPLAVFLTTALAAVIAGAPSAGPAGFVIGLAWQAVGGAGVGLAAGAASAWLKPRIALAPGLRPLFTLAGGLFAFGLAQGIGASGFLAVYLAGLVQARAARGLVEAEARALDGFAWLSQLALFLLLGLLAAPSHLMAVMGPALAVALSVALIARPLAVWASLAPYRFTAGERIFAAWTGLRGATPIFLGLIPVAAGAPNANLYFSIAVVVVVVSLVAQGWSTPWAARALGVTEDAEERPLALRPAPLAAFAGAAIAACAAAVWVARDIAPAALPAWSPATMAELEARIDRPAPPLLERFPDDWAAIDPARRQGLFVDLIAPLVEAENARLAADRAEVAAFARAEAAGRALTLQEQARRDVLARAYRVRYEDLDELARRIDAVPIPLALAQAALMTGWGASEPAQRDNALFGRRGPGERGGFETLSASIADYARTLNIHPDFAPFRAARAKIRAEGREPTAADLVAHVGPFAQDADAFAAQVARVLASPNIAKLEPLASEPTPTPLPRP